MQSASLLAVPLAMTASEFAGYPNSRRCTLVADAPSKSELEIAPGVHVEPPGALRFQYARSGGPGGQNVNKLNTKAELWLPLDAIVGLDESALMRLRTLAGKRLTKVGELHIVAQTSRTQEANRQAALDRLRELLVKAMRAPKPRRQTRPSASSKRRRLESKKRRSEVKAARRSHHDE